MDIKGAFDNTAFKFNEGSIPRNLQGRCEESELYNQPDLLFLEDKYLLDQVYFLKIAQKFKIKEFNENLRLYKDYSFIETDDYNVETKLYNEIINENNIDGIKKNELNISVNHFDLYDKNKKIDFVQNLYILIFIANSTEFDDNEFEFKVKSDDRQITTHISFSKPISIDLLEIYKWIVSSKENACTRLKIIREIILNKQTFNLDFSALNSAKSSFNRIIKEETEKYFEQVNSLKNDFFIMSERVKDSYNSLHLKFLGWCSTIAIFIYDLLKDSSSEDLYYKLFFQSTEKIRLFLAIFLLSVILIWIIFITEMNNHVKEHKKIKQFYTEYLFFEDNDFNKYLPAPKISEIYVFIFKIVVTFLVLRLLIH